MSYGLQVFRSDGTSVLSQTMAGGRVFAGKISRPKDSIGGTVSVYTFADVASGTSLRVVQVGAGAHSWVTGTNGSSQATVTLTSSGSALNLATTTTLYVFTVNSVEPNYGIFTLNDSNERTVSSIYPCPEFIGKVTFSATPTSSSATQGTEGYWRYNHTTSTSIGAGRNRMILWKLPDNSADCWFLGTNFIESTEVDSYNLTATYIRLPATSFTMPEAYVFALDGLAASTDTYGIRVYNASGVLLFDGGKDHMVIKGYEITVDYPTSPGTTSTYSSLASLSGTTAILVPQYKQDVWTNNGTVSNGIFYTGGMRKVGSTLYTRLLRTGSAIDDAIISTTYTYGLSSNVTQVVVDSTLYD